jgi:hypothetical protein
LCKIRRKKGSKGTRNEGGFVKNPLIDGQVSYSKVK